MAANCVGFAITANRRHPVATVNFHDDHAACIAKVGAPHAIWVESMLPDHVHTHGPALKREFLFAWA
ncbi:MAG TPA: hypothetical protein VMV70_06170, partial [Gallionella sp.]|nr:hypothetical protein [Gallionella sp.]HUW76249.1 hypothetical protein [Gallionella sp.]